ncbi:MAG: YeeE/YedE thiosulfate transporter family protein, partial [Chromatiales bacterium]
MSQSSLTSHVIRRTFTQSWSPYAGAVVILLLCLGLMQQGLFWGVFGGLKLWGDHLNSLIGLAPYLGIDSELPDPFLHRISLMNIVLFLGAMSAALISRQFRINRPPPLEYVWGAGGGILMGLGATLAGGCTVGGFFTPAMFSSPAGWTMWAGLLIGVVIGLKLLYWTFEHVTWGMQAPVSGPRSPMLRYFPVIGLLVMAAVVAWSVSWSLSTDKLESNRGFLLA